LFGVASILVLTVGCGGGTADEGRVDVERLRSGLFATTDSSSASLSSCPLVSASAVQQLLASELVNLSISDQGAVVLGDPVTESAVGSVDCDFVRTDGAPPDRYVLVSVVVDDSIDSRDLADGIEAVADTFAAREWGGGREFVACDTAELRCDATWAADGAYVLLSVEGDDVTAEVVSAGLRRLVSVITANLSVR
jgi:hypothetical protein